MRNYLSKQVLPALLCVPLFAGCALESGGPDDGAELDTVEEHADTPTTLTIFSEPNLSGDHLVATLTPTSDGYADKGIYAAEMQAAHMVGRASSARLQCGTRPSDAYFFGSEQFFAGEWLVIHCEPGATAQINFHTAQSIPGHQNLGDRIVYALLVDRTVSAVGTLFSYQLIHAWDAKIDDMLGSGASTDGEATLAFAWGNQFHIRQPVTIHTPWYCSEAHGWFEFDAGFTMGTTHRPSWAVYSQTSVSGGGLCHDDAASEFKDRVKGQQATFATMLNGATDFGAYTSYYFVPEDSTDTFNLDFGPI